MKKRSYGLRAVLLTAGLILAALICASCADGGGRQPGEEETPAAGTYEIYTVDLAGGLGEPYEYVSEETEPLRIAEELVEQMTLEPEATGHISAIPEDVGIPSVSVSGSAVQLAFGGDYGAMDPVREILSRAAIVETLTQVQGVSFVVFTVDGEPLKDANGPPVGYMQASDIISSVSAAGDVITMEMTLRFWDAEAEELVPESREVSFASHTSPETAAVRALVGGPEDEGLLPVLPADTTIFSVQVRDRICYVNLGSEFTDEAPDLPVYVPINALVLTLLDLDGIDSVQILVNGSSSVLFRDLIPLDQVFSGAVDESAYLTEVEGV
ncbi:MAG: GerMN domain-containing protein [Lachnospiraceae bacterium]|nr:GerMN domain-containing protein [Lachnospiraceae bacterium]